MDRLEKQLLEINSDSIENSRRFGEAKFSQILYFVQISYGYAPISRRPFNNLNEPNPNYNIPKTSL